MSGKDKPQFVVKRVKRGGQGHHGGAWKIAYADFVTAMMAFFLLMWLLGSTTQGDLEGIAEYFKTPLRVAMQGGSGSGDATSVIRGGGMDLTRRHSQVRRGDVEAQKKTIRLKAPDAEVERAELTKLRNAKARLEKALEGNPVTREYREQMLIDITTEGLRVQLVDKQNRPMFEIGKAVVLPHMREILREVGKTLNAMPNRIALSGHTDAKLYSSGERGYSNWELSADRANASRRELVAAGMAETKIVRVVGLSSAVLLDKSDPYNPVNRRISIIVMNKSTEDEVLKDGGAAR